MRCTFQQLRKQNVANLNRYNQDAVWFEIKGWRPTNGPAYLFLFAKPITSPGVAAQLQTLGSNKFQPV